MVISGESVGGTESLPKWRQYCDNCICIGPSWLAMHGAVMQWTNNNLQYNQCLHLSCGGGEGGGYANSVDDGVEMMMQRCIILLILFGHPRDIDLSGNDGG